MIKNLNSEAMVLATPTPTPPPTPTPICIEMTKPNIELPVIDLASTRSEVASLIVKACEEYGFFKVINHGVPQELISQMEKESLSFFSKPNHEKQMAAPANPFGYGCKNIGFNGDTGEVEYLLLNTNPTSIAQRSQTISNDPAKFSSVVSGYVEAAMEVACEILDLMAEGLRVPQPSLFSSLIRDADSDSILRLNHYPPHGPNNNNNNIDNVGFGEHSDPQMLTILTSNGVGGLQISVPSDDGLWVPVSPHPSSALCVNVGDALHAMTNGRFVSVRHRALTNSHQSRMSMAYFAAPPLQANIWAPPEMGPRLYKTFTWAEYKKAAFSLRLGDTRLSIFKIIKPNSDLL